MAAGGKRLKTPPDPPPPASPAEAGAGRLPVSVKGVLLLDGRAVLLRNERDEWELPGGRLEAGEDPPAALVREMEEELAITVRVAAILDCWRYAVRPGREVLIVTYGCEAQGTPRLVLSPEHREVGTFAVSEIDALPMPEGYRRSIRDWAARRR